MKCYDMLTQITQKIAEQRLIGCIVSMLGEMSVYTFA